MSDRPAGQDAAARVESSLFEHDPIGINAGEHRPEAESIVARLN